PAGGRAARRGRSRPAVDRAPGSPGRRPSGWPLGCWRVRDPAEWRADQARPDRSSRRGRGAGSARGIARGRRDDPGSWKSLHEPPRHPRCPGRGRGGDALAGRPDLRVQRNDRARRDGWLWRRRASPCPGRPWPAAGGVRLRRRQHDSDPPKVRTRYAAEGARPVDPDFALPGEPPVIVRADLLEPGPVVRHAADKLGLILSDLAVKRVEWV